MPIALPPSIKTLLEDKAYGHVVTVNASGKPQLTMVWMDVEGNEVLFNTAEGRLKAHNLHRNPQVIVTVQNRHEPQSYALFHGKGRITEEGADAQIDKLAKRFLGLDKYPWRRPDEKRLMVRISVDRIGGLGPKGQPWS